MTHTWTETDNESVSAALLRLYTHSKVHPLYAKTLLRREHIVTHRGNLDNPRILFVGEAPGKDEAKQGRPFVGRAGKLLNKWIATNRITDYGIINVMTLLPLDKEGNIRKPYDTEISFFRPYILELIEAIKPERIICLGKTAAQCLRQEWRPLTWHGNIGIMYHPAYYLRGRVNQGYQDFEHLLAMNEKFI